MIIKDDYKWEIRKMNLIIDAPFWVGKKSKWEKDTKTNNGIIAMDDNLLAYELANIRYNNLIQVHKIEFLEKYLCISLDDDRILSIAYCSDSDYAWILEECSNKNEQQNDRILSIAYCSDSDYAWILEECSNKNEQQKMSVFCQGNEIFAKNIPEII